MGYGDADTPVDAIYEALDEFQDFFRERWGLDAQTPPTGITQDAWVEAKEVAAKARKLATIAEHLIREQSTTAEELNEPEEVAREAELFKQMANEFLKDNRNLDPRVIEHLGRPITPVYKHRLWDDAMQLEAFRLFPPDLEAIARRLETLARNSVRFSGDRSAAYLRRVARCYALGLAPELAIMARAVIDSALQEVLDDSEVKAQRSTNRTSASTSLADRLKYCKRHDLLRPKEYDAASSIQRAGNLEVHVAPTASAPTPDEILENLAVALEGVRRIRDTNKDGEASGPRP